LISNCAQVKERHQRGVGSNGNIGLHCLQCKTPIKPLTVKKYLTFQPTLCDRCIEINNQEKERRLKRERLGKVREIAIEAGAPSAKVYVVNKQDFQQFKFSTSVKPVTVEDFVNYLSAGQQMLFQGSTDSGKTHLTTYLFMRLIYHYYNLESYQFHYAYLNKIYTEIMKDISTRSRIVNTLKYSKVVFLTFGEHADELMGSDRSVKPFIKDLFHEIIDYRLEEGQRCDLTTAYITTWDADKIKFSYGEEFLNRFYEKCMLVKMRQRNFRRKAFEVRPQIEVA
jgi:DNA replication protein DnaC